MKLLTPLGLLGLLSIAVLILIYILKPNYQQKMISSTYIWKLSLQYKKKRVPISKLRNLLIIICQILILTAFAGILSGPIKVFNQPKKDKEIIAIIDSSASMRTQWGGKTRFERAVTGVSELSADVIKKGGLVSVIVADNTPDFLVQRYSQANELEMIDALDALLESEETECSYGVSDVESALALCRGIVKDNDTTKIYLYTDSNYSYVPENINVVNVSKSQEWNAAVLDAQAEIRDNFYSFYVDVACYGRNEDIGLTMEVHNANAEDSNGIGEKITFTTSVTCNQDITKRVVFMNKDLYEGGSNVSEDVKYYLIEKEERIYSYQSIHIFINVNDSFREDDSFNIYNGQKEVLKIQYASAEPEHFMMTMLNKVQAHYSDYWDIQITTVKKGNEPALEGFDFYIFEHSMPTMLPLDGIVMMVNPNSAPAGAGFRVQGETEFKDHKILEAENADHKFLRYMTPENITVSKCVRAEYDASRYETLLSCDGGQYPVLSVSDEEHAKIAVLGFSLHYSNFALIKEFPLLMLNVFEYFFPNTVNANSFEVNETIELNARGEKLTVTTIDGKEPQTFDSFPNTMTLDIPGTYTMKQNTFTHGEVVEYIYVKISSAESNIWAKKETMSSPYQEQELKTFHEDLLIYIAATLVALLFIEWWLHRQENL